MKRLKYTIEQLKLAIEENASWRGVAKSLGLNSNGGGIFVGLKRITKENNFSTTHFSGSAHNRGKKYSRPNMQIPVDLLLCENSPHQRNIVKNRIIKNKLLPHKECSICRLTSWEGKDIAMILDHINGIHNDHRIDNLRFICPNCNSQLPTFAGRNKAKR